MIEAASELLTDELEAKVRFDVIDTEKPCFNRLETWFTHIVLRFLTHLICPSDTSYVWKEKITTLLAVRLTEIFTKDFITLIQRFPESTPCL